VDDRCEARIPRCYVAELADFFAAHDQWLFGHACVRTRGDRELAADLVQDTFDARVEASPRSWPASLPDRQSPERAGIKALGLPERTSWGGRCQVSDR
jgi:DNA-directed RNA polymerase specialized sigma24 family protein